MEFFVFTDIDGTLLNHSNYSYGDLKKFIKKIKSSAHIIFNTSKTFSEIKNIQKQLDLDFPFIAENGACIFFPHGYLNENVLNTLEEAYKGVTDDIKERQEKEAQLIADEEVRKLFNDNLPIPSLDFMSDDDLRVIFNTTYGKILIDQKTEEERLRIIKSFAQSSRFSICFF